MYNFLSKIIFCLILFSFFQLGLSQDIYESSSIQDKGIGNNKSYIISTTIRLGKSSSIEQADKKAFNYSAETVLRRRGSFEIASSTILQEQNNGEFFNQMISVELDGEVKEHKILDKKIYIESEDIFVNYTFQFWIDGKSKKDPYFTIVAEADKYELTAGDKIEVTFKSTKDCYLYLYNYLPYENKITPLFNTQIKKNDPWEAKLRTKFRDVKDECSEVVIQSFEHIIFLAIKKEKNILLDKKYVTYEEFQKKLKRLPREDYKSKMVSYTLNKN